MENSSLRSLEAWDRPLGTERSVLPPTPRRGEGPSLDFAADVERAQSRRADRSSPADDRRRSRSEDLDEPDVRENEGEEIERTRREAEPRGETTAAGRAVVAEPPLADVLSLEAAPEITGPDPLPPARELAANPAVEGAAPEAEVASAETSPAVTAEATGGGESSWKPVQVAVPEVVDPARQSRAAIDMAQAGRVSALPAPGAPLQAAPDPVPVADLPQAPAMAGPGGPGAELAQEGGDPADTESFARATAERPRAPTDRGQELPERAFDVARVADRRAPRVEPAQPRQTDRPLPPERAGDVLRQVRLHLAPGLRAVTVRLQPAWLGRIAIRIAIEDGRATTEVRAENKSALEALERHVPELRAAFEQQGIEPGELQLSHGFEDGSAGTRHDFESDPGPGRSVTFAAPEVELTRDSPRPSAEGGIDTYA